MGNPDQFPKRECGDDSIHAALRKAVERRQKSYLWTPADSITFTPRVSPTIYGDGRALFKICTTNQRPAYWIIRACSTWGCAYDREDLTGPDFAEMADTILFDLEDSFGRGRCGYCGNSLFEKRKYRMQFCQCEECADTIVEKWPAVDTEGGCSWGRMDWPASFATENHPHSRMGNLLLTPKAGA